MNTNPYSDFDEQRVSGATPKQESIRSIVLVLGIIGILLCGGLGTLLYFGYQQASPQPPVAMQQPSTSFDTCLADLNESLEGLVADSESRPDSQATTIDASSDNPVEAEIRQFMTTHVDALSIGDEVPFNDAQFIEAVSNSSLLTTPLSLMQRIQLKAWIAAAPPLPWAGGEMKIVGIRVPQNRIATVDFLLHIGNPEAETFRWHLVKADGAWQLYDWRALDFGQSMSDEYAGYMVDQTSVAEGYDRINELIDEADTAFEYEDDEEKARRLLRTAEQTPVLDSDRPDATLRIAYAWRAMEEYEEAIRVAKLVPSPEQRLGVWPLICACYLELKDFDQAMEAANALAELSPHHPNVHLLKSEIWWAQNDVEKTVMAAIPALQVIPEDTSTWWDVIYLSKPEFLVEQSPTWIPWLIRAKQLDPLLDLLESATLANDPTLCLQALDAAYVPAGLTPIAKGNLADRDGKNDEAVEWFLKAEQESTEEALVDYAGERRHEIRLLSDEYEQLLSDGNDVDANLKRLLTTAYDYELECDHRRMLGALNANENMLHNNPWATCFRAYLHGQLLEPAKATRHYAQVQSFLEENQEESDGFGLFDSIQDDYVAALLVQNRPLDVLRQWPESADLYFQVGEYLVKLNNAKMTEQFLAFLPTETDAAWFQQTQRERLLAIQAVDANDMTTGHQHHIRSVELAQAVEDMESWSPYSQRSLIKEYADSLVRKSVTAAPPNYNASYLQQQFLQSAMEQAANQGSADLLEHYTAELQRVSDSAEDSIAGSYATNLEFLHADGNHAEAKALSEKILEEYDPEDYNFQLAMQAAADYYLETDEFGDAIRCLEKTDPSVDPHVTVAFARADGVALEKHFASTNRDTVWEWFSDHAHWLRPHSQTRWFGELQDRYRLPLTIHYAQEDLTLLFPANIDLSPDQILVALQSSVQASSAGTLKFTKIRTARPGCESWSFVPTSENWQLIVTLETGRVQLDNGPLDVQKQLAKPVTRLSLQWFGKLRNNSFKLSKTAFEVTVTLAAHGAFALAHEGRDYHAYVWDLKTATPLTWNNRFSKPYAVSYLETIPDATLKEFPFTRWNRMFRASDGALPVEVIVMNHYGNEVVPGIVVNTLPEQEMLVVRMEADSMVDSLVIRGREYSVENYELRLPEPQLPAKAEQ